MTSQLHSNELLATRPAEPHPYSPLSRVPHEILGLIFTSASHDTTIFTLSSKCQRRWGPSVISAVCRRWREVALETPSMWSSLQVAIDTLDYDPTGVLDALHTHIHRSGNTTMSCRVVVGEVKRNLELDGMKEHADILSTLFSHENASRIGNLELYVSSRSRKFINQLMELHAKAGQPDPCPSRMSSLTLASPLSAESQPPKYSMIDWDVLAPSFFPSSRITSLTLEAQLPTVWSSLRSFPQLLSANITLVPCRDHRDLLDTCPEPTITLSSLQSLAVWNGHRAAPLFETIDAPELEKLCVSSHSSRRKDYVVQEFEEEIFHVRDRLVDSISNLVERTKGLREVGMVDMDFRGEDVARIVKALPDRQVKLAVVVDGVEQ